MERFPLGTAARRGRTANPFMAAAAWWAVLIVFWLLCVTSLAPPEIQVGLVAATLATAIALGVRATTTGLGRPRARWLLLLRPVPWGILHDTALVLGVLQRRVMQGERPRGAWHLVRVPVGDDQSGEAWRAFVITATSVAPNTYVIGIDREQGTALVHQLAPTARDKVRASVVGAS